MAKSGFTSYCQTEILQSCGLKNLKQNNAKNPQNSVTQNWVTQFYRILPGNWAGP